MSGLMQALAHPPAGPTKGVVVVMFYANWCSHCIDTLPVFAKAKELLTSTQQAEALVQVDVAKHRDLVQKYGVKAFPTIRAYLRGQPVGPPYAGLREAEDMAKWTRDIIANPPPPEEPSSAPTNHPESGSGTGKRPKSITRATAGKRPPPVEREDTLSDEKLANAMERIGKRMAEQTRRGENDGDRPTGPDDPDGLDEGWFPLGKQAPNDKGGRDAGAKTFSADPLYGHSDEF